jgi:hypothetical protein
MARTAPSIKGFAMNMDISRPDWGNWAPLLLTIIVVAAGAAVAFW